MVAASVTAMVAAGVAIQMYGSGAWERQASAHQNPILAKFSICYAIRDCRTDLGTWPDSPEHMLRIGGKAPSYRPYLSDRVVVLGPGDFAFRRLSTSADGSSARYEIRRGNQKPARCDLLDDKAAGPHWVP